jgi:predicted nucleic acid-binding protein
VAVVYFDSSALVKLLVEEDDSSLADELWDRCDVPVTCRLAYPEVRAALAAAARAARIDARGLTAALLDWDDFWRRVRAVELTSVVAREAGRLAVDHPLSGADAVHLASALQLTDDVIVATWDHRLHAAAVASGLAVVPARLD